jgi:DNA-binding IclR family transcriptional regulator
VDYWRERLPEGERKTLDVILADGPGEVARESIDVQTGYKRSSRDAYLTRLKARGLVEFSGRGTVRASEELFGSW